MQISRTVEVIAIECENANKENGILASVENESGDIIVETDVSWKCTSTKTSGWEKKDFKEHSSWPQATLSEKVLRIGEISETAKWIWADNEENFAYCRYWFNKGFKHYMLILI